MAQGFAQDLKESGNALWFPPTYNHWLPVLIGLLKEDAAKLLPPGSRYEIRRGDPSPMRDGIAWYRADAMDEANEWGSAEPGPRDGYILVEQCVTPALEAAAA